MSTKGTEKTIPFPAFLPASAEIRPRATIPNREGFAFCLVAPNRMLLPAVVRRDANGCHYAADLSGAHRGLAAFVGWVTRAA